jgi:hypothetical protein
MQVLPLDDGGQVVLEHVREPLYTIKDSQIWELLSESDGERRFGQALKDLSLKWYRQPSLDACLAERRNPLRTDCYDAREIQDELRTIHTRLRNMEGSLPRRYTVRSDQSEAQWESSVKVWFEGRVMRVGAGWDHCMAMSTERPSLDCMAEPSQLAEQIRMLVEHRPEVQIDLRGQEKFSCHEAIKGDAGIVPGRPMTLTLASESAATVYGGFLDEMEAFCRAVDPHRYCVMTSRS